MTSRLYLDSLRPTVIDKWHGGVVWQSIEVLLDIAGCHAILHTTLCCQIALSGNSRTVLQWKPTLQWRHVTFLSVFCNIFGFCASLYTPKAVVIDNHLPRQPLISSYVPDWPLPPRVYIPWESEMALRARIYAYNRHLSFDVAFICSTLTHCGVCHLSVWRLKWEVSYVHQSVWRWKWFFCQSNYVLQRLRLCRTSDTVFRREIDSRRQWGYRTCYGGIISPLRRSVASLLQLQKTHLVLFVLSCTEHSAKKPLSTS